jgi:hypothetical protein
MKIKCDRGSCKRRGTVISWDVLLSNVKGVLNSQEKFPYWLAYQSTYILIQVLNLNIYKTNESNCLILR